MNKFFKKVGISILTLSVTLPSVTFSPLSSTIVQAASSSARIHYLTLPSNTEAIVLECNGRFGMVDSGEDKDYPTGKDPRYPKRAGIVTNEGYETEVINYLRSLGVNQKNFEFYIGTHPHSDHIGTADEVIKEFHPKRVYIQEYKDSYISNKAALWDNLYVYDHMLQAASDTGATIIQNFVPGAPLYPEKVSVAGNIFWEDQENQDGIRPEHLKVILTNPVTQKKTEQTITPDSSGKWRYQFTQLQKYDDNKNDISYQVEMTAPDGYTISSENGWDFTCSHQVTTTNQTITVNWEDSNAPEDSRPTTLNVELQKQTAVDLWEPVQSLSLTPDAAGTWNYQLSQLPLASEDDTPIVYRLQVIDEITNYTFDCPEGEFSITASYIGEPAAQEETPSGIQDDFSNIDNTGVSDQMQTASIPATDQVSPDNQLDPTMIRTGEDTPSAQTGIFDTLAQTQNTISTPTFTLGGDMKIEIMNYGGDYKTNPKPDANYFCLGVKVTANGKTAFLAGDINNYEGAETRLAQQLGHVDILTLGHHGYYGSNTNNYVKSLTPKMMILAGNYKAVSTQTLSSGEISTLNTLIEMGNSGVPLYPTAWYSKKIPAIIINFNAQLSNNIPPNTSFIGGTDFYYSPLEHIYYKNGLPAPYNGRLSLNGYNCYFDNSVYASKNKWYKDSNGDYYYYGPNGTLVTGWINYNGTWYYANSSGIMQTGWLDLNGTWYYLNNSGAMVTGAQTIGGKAYYFTSNGAMVTSTWAEGKYYGPDGVWIPYYKNEHWRKNNTGWWYQRTDGSYPVNQWELIDGAWYYFNNAGYMVTGWLNLNGTWYYLDKNGVMLVGSHKINGTWYYFDGSGKMVTGWVNMNGTWYYYAPGNGGMYGQGWHWINGKCYYMYASGAMAANTWIGNDYVDGSGAWVPGYARASWIKSGNRWWYRHSDGSYTRSGWELINGTWYHFDGSGWMQTGWLNLNGTWYYLAPSGAMYGQGWHWINGKCYYMYASGAMAANTRIGGYYVDGSGAWIPGK